MHLFWGNLEWRRYFRTRHNRERAGIVAPNAARIATAVCDDHPACASWLEARIAIARCRIQRKSAARQRQNLADLQMFGVAADDGRDVYVHSKYRPVAEARTLIDDLNTDENPTFFIAGFGLGYHLVELERVMESPLLIVAEDDLALVKSGLCCADLAEPIRDGRLLLLNSAERLVAA